jgi:hypothetical protein
LDEGPSLPKTDPKKLSGKANNGATYKGPVTPSDFSPAQTGNKEVSLVSKLTDIGVPWGALPGILASLGKVIALQKASIYMPSGLLAREDSVSLWLKTMNMHGTWK